MQHTPLSKFTGFTLIELLVALVIIGILATIALPTYHAHVAKGRRVDGKSALLHLATRMEHYHQQNNTYAGASLAALGLSNPTAGGFYNLEIMTASAMDYTIAAIPLKGQATHDAACGSFTLDHLGRRSITGSSNLTACWG
jgi:type IV pilus assembly protein PilE